jgi:quinone-modifying oxidoreductase, subunit QmoC
MASTTALAPSEAFRARLLERGGASAAKCYQCATCSAVCELAPAEAPFPRRQMLWAQWGLSDRLAADPSIWLCHQCNDCNLRCPRDAQPGDVLQVLRGLVVEKLAFPSFMGRLVGNAGKTWPLLIGAPILLWVLILLGATGFAIPHVNPDLPALEGQFHYTEFVPHYLIYIVYTLVTLWVLASAWTSGTRFWTWLGAGAARHGSFVANVIPALVEVATHARFAKCGGATQRRWGHFLLMWGFVGAAVTSGFLVVYLYGLHMYPLPLDHWVKWLGNISAVALVVGGAMLYLNRLPKADRQAGDTNSFDRFFLWTVLAVVVTGCLTEVFRFLAPPLVACLTYVLHLGVVFTLFITFPYSKFAHLLYRTLAMVHERMARGDARG